MRKVLLAAICFFYFCSFAFAQVESKPICPSISLIGPEGIVHPGTKIHVKAVLSRAETGNLNYDWSTDKGKIFDGQSTPSIIIDTEDIDARGPSAVEIDITVKIDGLPEGCEATASEKYLISTGIYDPVPADMYWSLPFSEEKARLDNLATHVLSSKQMVGYIIKGFKTGTPDTNIRNRIERIKNFLYTTRKYPRDRFVILIRESNEVETQLWKWPSTETFPMCEGCKPLL